MRIANTLSYMFGAVLLVSSAANVAMAEQPQEDQQQQQPSASMMKKQTVTATVEKVDKKDRKLMLKDQQGNPMTVKVPESVKRFDEIKPGDQINVSYYETLIWSMKKAEPGAQPSAKETTVMTREGTKLPGGAMARQITATVVVEKVDPSANKVTVQMPDGEMHTIHVTDPQAQKQLSQLKQGDRIQAKYTEAVAVDVQRPQQQSQKSQQPHSQPQESPQG